MTAGAAAAAIRIGARFPSAGVAFAAGGMASAARILEDAGYDSLWASDHLAMPRGRSSSVYPYSGDGRIPWGSDLGWNEALTSLGIAAGVTCRIELGTAVLVAALRHPLLAARQAAAVAVEAGGRVTLGIGAGWLIEEFEAVGVPFVDRGRYLDHWIPYVRDVWAGTVAVHGPEDPYPNPEELTSLPMPPDRIGLVIGGMSSAALRRTVQLGDGWIGIVAMDGLDVGKVGAQIQRLRAEAELARRDPKELRVLLQVTGSAGRMQELRPHLEPLAAAGVDDILIDVDWRDPDQPAKDLQSLRDH